MVRSFLYDKLPLTKVYIPPSESPTQEPNVGGNVRVEDIESIEGAFANLRDDLNNS